MSIHRRAARRDDNEPAIRKRFAHNGWHTEQLSGAGMPDLIVFKSGHKSSAPGFAHLRYAALVDVKMPGGTVTDPQKKKWGELRDKGIPVYVVRTAEDVDALVRGELAAWDPFACPHGARCVHGCGKSAQVAIALAPGTGMSGGTKRGARPGQVTPRGKGMRPPENGSDRLKPCGCKRSLGRCGCRGEDPPLPPADGGYREWAHATDTRRQPRPSYTPPRSTPVDDNAAFDAEVRRRIGLKADKGAEETFAPPCTGTVIGKPPFQVRVASSGYTPPRSTPVDAAKEAEETFAPPPTRPCVTCGVLEATVADLLCFPCSVAS